MDKVKTLEKEIETLSADELKSLREWFIEFDSNAWDRQIEADAVNGKPDALAKQAIASHQRGESTEI